MTLAPGTRLGTYEIASPLGAGGMGEVFRARDTKLNRDVAIKVLPGLLAQDKERVARFRREAQVLASLNHPNIAAIHGLEEADGHVALVLELVAGDDLAERLKRGAIPVDEALAVAKQITEALEEAHEHGIVHRDLKPANVKVTPDGKVKVLDFGLAKAFEGEPDAAASGQLSHSPTMSRHATEAGLILGTAAYMSPEQARGKAVDKRADIWSFGVVLWEMLTGQRLFAGETVSDVLAAVLTREPEWAALPPQTSGRVRELLRRCLDRNPRNRLHDIADARLVLEDALAGRAEELPARDAVRHRRRVLHTAVPLGLALGLALGYLAAQRGRPAAQAVTFERLTFRPGHFTNARFAPDGQTVFYSAAWDGSPRELFQSRPKAGELALGLRGVNLLSVSRAGELALLLPRTRGANPYTERGTLGIVSASGGTPRELADGVVYADWAPDGKTLAVIRESGGLLRLEFPLGERRHEAAVMYWPRVSPDGQRVALFEQEAEKLSLVVFERSGARRVLSPGWADWWNLAWRPDGREVWFGAAHAGAAAALYAVDLDGRVREVASAPGTLEMHDIAADGRALVARVSDRTHVFGRPARGTERKLSWLELTSVADLSADGRRLLLRESSEREAGQIGVLLREMDGAPPVRLGGGLAEQLSPDGKWALAIRGSEVVALPTGSGAARSRETRLASLAAARWMPDGRGVLIAGRAAGGGLRLFAMGLDEDAPPRAVSQDFDSTTTTRRMPLAISPDGRHAAVSLAAGGVSLLPLDGGAARELPGGRRSELPVRWTSDPKKLYVFDPSETPARVFVLDIDSGRRSLVLEIHPHDSAGVYGIDTVAMTPAGDAYAYHYSQFLSDLYLVEGLR